MIVARHAFLNLCTYRTMIPLRGPKLGRPACALIVVAACVAILLSDFFGRVVGPEGFGEDAQSISQRLRDSFDEVYRLHTKLCEDRQPLSALFAKFPFLTEADRAKFAKTCKFKVKNTPAPFRVPDPRSPVPASGLTIGEFYLVSDTSQGVYYRGFFYKGFYYGDDGAAHWFKDTPDRFVTKPTSSDASKALPRGTDFVDFPSRFAETAHVKLGEGIFYAIGPAEGAQYDLVVPPNCTLEGAGMDLTALRIVGRCQIALSSGSTLKGLKVDANGAQRVGEPPKKGRTYQTGKYITPIRVKESVGAAMVQCELTGSGDYGMTVGKSTGFSLIGCRFNKIQRLAVVNLGSVNTTIDGCTFELIGCDCITDGNGSSGTVVKNCACRNVGNFQFKTNQGCAFIYGRQGRDITVENNDISGCGANSMDFIECDNVVCRGNKIRNGGATGIGLFGVRGGLVENNDIRDCNLRAGGIMGGIGVTIAFRTKRAATNIVLRGNVIRGCRFGLSYVVGVEICDLGNAEQFQGNTFGPFVGKTVTSNGKKRSETIVTMDPPIRKCP